MPPKKNNFKDDPLKAHLAGRSKKTSNFLLTINTNEAESDIDKQEEFIETVNELFTDENNQTKLIKYTKDGDDSKYITKIEVEVGEPELSPKYQRLHVHVLYSIEHYTGVRLDRDFIEKHLKEKLNINHALYINIKVIKTVAESIEDIKKYVRGDKAPKKVEVKQ